MLISVYAEWPGGERNSARRWLWRSTLLSIGTTGSNQRGHGIGIALDVYTYSSVETRRGAAEKLERSVLPFKGKKRLGSGLTEWNGG
jgi:hypothetical protein